jgi:hypothetical protein
MIKRQLKYSAEKTILNKGYEVENFDLIQKKAGRDIETYIFNIVEYEVTNLTIKKLNDLSNKSIDFINLSEKIKNTIFDNPSIKKFIDSFIGKIIKYDREKFIKLFEEFIDYDDYKYLSIDEIDTRIVLEFFIQREEYEVSYKYKSTYDKRVSNLRTNYNLFVFEESELNDLEKLIGKTFNLFSFNLELEKIFEDERINIARLMSINFEESNYIKDYRFPYFPNGFQMPKINQFPFSYLDTHPRYAYPILPNSVILPLTHRLPGKNNSYQQVELSTASCHTAYYYRLARWRYILNRKKINFDLFIDLLQDDKIEIKPKVLQKLINLLNSDENSIIKLKKLEKPLGTFYELVKDIVVKIYSLERLIFENKDDLLDAAKKIVEDDKYATMLEKNIIIERDKDLFGNDIPFFYKEDLDGEVFYCYDLKKKEGYKETRFIVAKEMLDINGSKKGIDIQTVNDLGIEKILDNDVDFPVKRGFYDINTPKTIYYPPFKNNFISKGVFCYDGVHHYNWLKRTRVLYVPDYWVERTKDENLRNYKKIEIDNENFIIPDGRELSSLPALAYSHILTPMDDKDKLNHFENSSKK